MVFFGLIGRKLRTASEPITDLNIQQAQLPGVDSEKLKGKVVMLVNTASECGYRGQLNELTALKKEFPSVEIIGMPTSDFLNQEKGTNEEVVECYMDEFDVDYILGDLIHVKGNDIHPFYAQLIASELGGAIEWNFSKWIFDTQGNLVARIKAATSPTHNVVKDFISTLAPSTTVSEPAAEE
ncbi:hypothetical protein PCE1_003023 [Barthelona sp. PCE]